MPLYAKLRPSLQDLFDELKPRVAISIGLWPGEPTIRLERIGVNVADFEIPDNEGALVNDAPVSDNGQAAEFGSSYDSPGWKRAQANRAAAGAVRTRPPLIEAQAWSVQTSDPTASAFARGDRVFHQKFGYGRVTFVEGNKLTVNFDKAGEKRVIDQFVSRA